MLVEDKYDRWERGMGIEKKSAGLKTKPPHHLITRLHHLIILVGARVFFAKRSRPWKKSSGKCVRKMS